MPIRFHFCAKQFHAVCSSHRRGLEQRLGACFGCQRFVPACSQRICQSVKTLNPFVGIILARLVAVDFASQASREQITDLLPQQSRGGAVFAVFLCFFRFLLRRG